MNEDNRGWSKYFVVLQEGNNTWIDVYDHADVAEQYIEDITLNGKWPGRSVLLVEKKTFQVNHNSYLSQYSSHVIQPTSIKTWKLT